MSKLVRIPLDNRSMQDPDRPYGHEIFREEDYTNIVRYITNIATSMLPVQSRGSFTLGSRRIPVDNMVYVIDDEALLLMALELPMEQGIDLLYIKEGDDQTIYEHFYELEDQVRW